MDELRGVVPPKQQRSRETVAKILAATDRLVVDRSFREITVQDLCNEAGVSASSFYARFPTKEDVLLAVFDLHSLEAREDASAAIQEVMDRAGSVDEVVRALLGAYLRFVRRNGPVMVSIFGDPSMTDRYWNLGSEISEDLVGLLCGLFGSDDREFRVVAEFAARVAAATIQRAIGLPTNFGERMGLDDERLLDELTAMLTPYLRAAAEESSSLD